MTFEFSLARLTQIAELLKFSNLKDEVEHSGIRASGDSDAMPVNECEHLWLSRANAKYQWTVFTFCPKCGEKL